MLICDSPFSNLLKLAKDIGNKKISIPNFIINIGLGVMQGSIKEKTGLDIYKLDLLKCINFIKLPILFLTSKEDTFIHHTHVQELFDSYNFLHKELVFVHGDHNSERTKLLI